MDVIIMLKVTAVVECSFSFLTCDLTLFSEVISVVECSFSFLSF